MDERLRNIALVLEIERATKYLQLGLGEIQKISPIVDFYDPLLLFLSNGFERLFKSMLCLNYKENNNKLPSYKELMGNKNGHDIEYLKKEVGEICIPIPRLFAANDYEIIKNDRIINSICTILSEFGQHARYFNLDLIFGTKQTFNSHEKWESIETELLKEHLGEDNFYSKLEKNELNELYEKSNYLLVCRLELFIRAIMRQFIFGTFSKEAMSYMSFNCFSNIDDDKIGETDYRQIIN